MTTRCSQTKKPGLWKTSNSFHWQSNKLLCIRVTTRFACLCGIIRFLFPTTIHWHYKGWRAWKRSSKSVIFLRENKSALLMISVKGMPARSLLTRYIEMVGFCGTYHISVIHPQKNKTESCSRCLSQICWCLIEWQIVAGSWSQQQLDWCTCPFLSRESIFYGWLGMYILQVSVPVSQRDLLRFLWWPQDDVSKDMVECQMHTHIFGASSSAVAKYALRKTASDNAEHVSPEGLMTVKCCFYVDGCLKSVSGVEESIVLAEELRKLTQKGGFRLTQWVSNDR